MRKLILLLVPLVLFAQVKVDTVIRLPDYLLKGFFIPELNKLYIHTRDFRFLVVDCSTYQLKAEIPSGSGQGVARYQWNPRRQKLYLTDGWPDTCRVVDPVADTVLKRFYMPSRAAYIPSVDRLYVGSWDGSRDLLAIDCASDTVVKRIPMPIPGYNFGTPAWDSVGNKLYVLLGMFGSPPWLAVYACPSDSLLALIDPCAELITSGMNFNYRYRKAYYTGDYAGVIDTKNDTLIKQLPVYGGAIAVNARDDKTYIAGCNSTMTDTVFVIDCATDSIVKKVVYYTAWYPEYAHWVPWSNRLYFANSCEEFAVVLDCNTDSIIVPELRLPGAQYAPIDIQLDPIRERIFAIGAESTSVHVLRDVVSGVAETPAPRPSPGATVRLRELRDAVELEYHLESPGWVDVAVFDPAGRLVNVLASARQPTGLHRLIWDRTDSRGAMVACGAYFVVLNTEAAHAAAKTVVR